MERAKGFEPSTSTLARLHSTPELRPLENYLETAPDIMKIAKLCKYNLIFS
jgi:hypothetical protein